MLGSVILIFVRFRSPCKISEPYDNPFWEKSNPSAELLIVSSNSSKLEEPPRKF